MGVVGLALRPVPRTDLTVLGTGYLLARSRARSLETRLASPIDDGDDGPWRGVPIVRARRLVQPKSQQERRGGKTHRMPDGQIRPSRHLRVGGPEAQHLPGNLLTRASPPPLGREGRSLHLALDVFVALEPLRSPAPEKRRINDLGGQTAPAS